MAYTLDGAIIHISGEENTRFLTLQVEHIPRFLSSPVSEHQMADQDGRMVQLYTKQL